MIIGFFSCDELHWIYFQILNQLCTFAINHILLYFTLHISVADGL